MTADHTPLFHRLSSHIVLKLWLVEMFLYVWSIDLTSPCTLMYDTVLTAQEAQHPCKTFLQENLGWPRFLTCLSSQPEQNKACSIPCPGEQHSKGRSLASKDAESVCTEFSVRSIFMKLSQERMFYRQECSTANRWGTEPDSTVLVPLCCFSKSLLIFIIYFPLPGLILGSSGDTSIQGKDIYTAL